MNPYLPRDAEVIERIDESPGIFTLRLRLTDLGERTAYRFAPGQFNMVYLHGAGEVPISIVSDPESPVLLDHTIRAVGRVTNGLAKLHAGDRVGIRGPFGRGWPLDQARGRDVVIVTGGLGCAPVVAVINYLFAYRKHFGHVTIIQGVKHASELIWRERYAEWAKLPGVQVLLSADHGGPLWPFHIGRVTDVFDEAHLPGDAIAMLCGPEIMMQIAARQLAARGIAEDDIYLSLERNMQCAIGHCGHCQFGPDFVCREGPVFAYPHIKPLFSVKGF
ncbi:MAG TPA: FAD/NAD(P)-binding protein [Burkholderiales bacterium]|nr:FAD/NAD(P)-binding protein [Burkholderiales bacterium]